MPNRPSALLLAAWLAAPALLSLALPAPAIAAPPSGPSRLLTGADLFNLEVASDPQISPDGRTVVYARRANDIMVDRTRSSIWSIDVASGEQTPLVVGRGSHSSPRWSPDGSKLAYVSNADGEAGAQLYVRWMRSGVTARITGLPDSPEAIAWSPDGKRIAYAMFVPDEGAHLGKAPDKPEGAKWADPLQVIDSVVYRTDEGGYNKSGYEQVFWVPADGGAPTQLTFGARNAGGRLSWSPDGRSVLFSSNLTKDWERDLLDDDVHEVSIDDLQVRTLTHRKGPNDQPMVSPDGKSIAYVGFEDKYLGYQDQRLSVMNRDGSASRELTASLDRNVGDPVWAADGRSIYVDYEDHGSVRVARVGLDGTVHTVAERLTASAFDRPYSGGDFSVARDGTVAYTSGTTQRPSDVWIARDGHPRQLTHLNEALAAKKLGNVQHFEVAAFDKLPIDAWMVTPPDFDASHKYPLILEIHGGPFAGYGPTFSTDDQLYAAAGYVVLYINPRGSTGYGEAFANQIDKAYPGHDYDDLMSAVDAAIAKGFIDPDNLFVTGGSGGGALTAWIVGKTDRFRAAATQKPVIDWASFALTSDVTPYYQRYWFAKFPWEDPTGYWARSPLSLVGNVKTPTLVVVGSNDFRTPDSEAEQFYTALQLRGIPTAFVKVPGANHEGLAGRPSQSAAKASAILAWFERYRTKQAGQAPAAP
ncbi:MAG TPA: S9 family peptidase [Xanthomonadaceae bacterium]|jgi:dipeptidyl aminopeptidase/acylaminoacyl peptidase